MTGLMRVASDDEVYQVRTVWLGPTGMTFPWTARYQAYAVWLLTFLAVLLFKAVTPLEVGIVPTWEVAFSVLFTYWLMSLVDFEQPIRSRLETLRAEVTAPRPAGRVRPVRFLPSVRVRERRPTRSRETTC